MAQPIENRGTIAIIGAVAAGVVAVLVGTLYWAWPSPSEPTKASNSPPLAVQQPAQAEQKSTAAEKPLAPKAEAKPKDGPIAPSFDLVRVEPNGESVIAGRAAPGATIELLRGDQVHARAVADASGLFAIVPPALPPGSHQVMLQSIAPDGVRQRSPQTVTVVIDTGGTRPLVTLASPDQPTVLLSNPEPPEPKVAEQPKAPEPQGADKVAEPKPSEPAAQPAPQQQAGATPPAPAPAQPAPRAEIKIVTVESEDGKLFVSGQAAPGATVRLYLNESMIAPGSAGGDGKLSFSIGSGVRPGDYRIRLDDVDPVSGQVKSRAEVGFNVPAQVASAEPEAPASAPQDAAKPVPEAQVAAAGTVVIPNINTAIVSRGDNLWRISQRIYGQGLRYTVIYGANQDQIRNPNLIYPGQVFVLPANQDQKTN
ncbi:LysM peptidoglycan-binding domain-containing protein [Microvirga sp. 2YAF29]|uniref:LysM peptidoglycan-binding domain-containing protein n=1 Tax=Microvirga sp. 2YAF29 TaxID=3233031 RepID=UPI003F9E5467